MCILNRLGTIKKEHILNDQLKQDPRYQHHESRPDLAGEHPRGDALQLAAFLIFIMVTGLDHWLVGSRYLIQAIIPFWIRVCLSGVFLSLTAYLSIHGIRIVFGEYREDPVMITHNMFSVIRHPIYLGVLLIYPAFFLLTRSFFSIPVWLATIFLYNWLAIDEEERMEKLFGEKYRQYIKKVPRWIPRFRR